MATCRNKPLTTSSSGDIFRCPICLEEVRIPKYISCLYTFCESCIQTYISSTAKCHESEGLKTIDCPVFRKRINAPRKDISDEEWAFSLSQVKEIPNKIIVSMSLNTRIKWARSKFCEQKKPTFINRHFVFAVVLHWN